METVIAYAEPSHAARAYPQLYRSGNAARMARARWRTNPYEQSFIGECAPPPGHIWARYQLTGAGQHPAMALINVAVCPDPRTAVEHAQGTLAAFELIKPLPAQDAPAIPVNADRAEGEQPRALESQSSQDTGAHGRNRTGPLRLGRSPVRKWPPGSEHASRRSHTALRLLRPGKEAAMQLQMPDPVPPTTPPIPLDLPMPRPDEVPSPTPPPQEQPAAVELSGAGVRA